MKFTCYFCEKQFDEVDLIDGKIPYHEVYLPGTRCQGLRTIPKELLLLPGEEIVAFPTSEE